MAKQIGFERRMAIWTIVVALGGCSFGQSVTIAEKGVATFRDQVAKQQFQEIYDTSEPEFKKGDTQATTIAFLSGASKKLGALKSSNRVGWHVNTGTGGTIVTLRYESVYEKGNAQEEFVLRVKGDQAHLVGYHVNSKTFVIDSKTTTA